MITTALKKGEAKQSWIDGAIKSMTTLNRKAAEVIAPFVGAGVPTCPAERGSAAAPGVHSMTDITGFGLIAHAREIALASTVSMRLFVDKIPVLEGALECIRAGHVPAGLKANREFAECVVEYEGDISGEMQAILFDPQTAGGLLISVDEKSAPQLARALNEAGIPAVEIGEVLPYGKPLITVS